MGEKSINNYLDIKLNLSNVFFLSKKHVLRTYLYRIWYSIVFQSWLHIYHHIIIL